MTQGSVCSPDLQNRHTVKAGDSLWKIASTKLGSPTRWPEIAELNGLQDPFTVFVGQVLYLPARNNQGRTSTSFPRNSAGGQCIAPTSSKPGGGKDPAVQVQNVPVKLKLDKDIPVIKATFPGGECTIGFKGELTMHRMMPMPITISPNDAKAVVERSQKAWAAQRYLELFHSVGLSVDRNGALTVIAKTGIETEWYKGTFDIKPDGSLKYEVEPKPVKTKYNDVMLEGNIGCWIEIKSNIRFDPAWEMTPRLVLTQQQIMSTMAIALAAYGAAAATGAASAGGSTISFGQFLSLLGRMAGTASSFMLILVPPGVLEELNQQSGRPGAPDFI